MNAKTIVTAAALAAAFITGAAQAAPAAQKSGEVYGYSYRVNDARSTFTDGARQGKFDNFSEGARIGNRDAFTDGARVTNRDGLVASIGSRDVYTDGTRIGNRDAFTDGARVTNRDGLVASIGSRDVYTDGARVGKADPFTDGAKAAPFDPYSGGARSVAGLDRTGVSAEPSRSFDVYTDGALA